MPALSSQTRSKEAHDSGEAIAVARPRAVGKETRVGDSEQPAPAPFAPQQKKQSEQSRSPWSGKDVSESLGFSTEPAKETSETRGSDAMGAASPAEVQLARSLVQLGLAHLQILQTTLLDAYHRAVSSLNEPGVRDLALQIAHGVAQVEHARDQIGPGEELDPLRTELDDAWQDAVSQLAVQVSPQILGGALVAASFEPPPRPHVVHLGADLIAREAGRVLELLEAVERIRSYVMPETEATSESAAPGDQLLAVAELERFASRPIDALFLAAILKRAGVWLELAQARGSDGRTAAQVLGHVEAQAAETGATVELGPKWNALEAADALSYGLTDWAVTDEDATRVVEMLQAASPQGRGALVKQLHRMGLLGRLAANVGWAFLQQIGETLNDPEAESLLSPHYEGKGGVPSSHELLMAQVDRNLQEGSALDTFQAGAWYLLDTSLDTLSFGGKSSIDRAHEARDAGLISEDAYWAKANKAMARTAAVGATAALTGGAAGAWLEGAALGLGASEGGAVLIGAATGGAVGNVGARFTGDIYDQLLSGKPSFDSFSAYAQDFASGGLFGAALAPVGLHAAKHLPASARTMAQTYAVRHPQLIPMLEAARAAGKGAAFRVRMTVREWLDVLRTGAGGPGPMGGFGGPQPAFASAGPSPDAAPDLSSLPPDAELWITARPTADLDAPMARLDEEAPWFEVESINVRRGGRRAESLLDDYGDEASYVDDPADYRGDAETDGAGYDSEDISTAAPDSYGGLGERVRFVRAQSAEPDLAGEYGVGSLSDARLGITRNPRHHLLPQEEIEFFQRNGFPGRDIDRYCIEVTTTEHEILHGGNQTLARRHWQEHEWSMALMKDLRLKETRVKARRGENASLSREEVLQVVERLRSRFDVQDKEVVPYRGSHD
jgi:hypothetical protein